MASLVAVCRRRRHQRRRLLRNRVARSALFRFWKRTICSCASWPDGKVVPCRIAAAVGDGAAASFRNCTESPFPSANCRRCCCAAAIAACCSSSCGSVGSFGRVGDPINSNSIIKKNIYR